MTCRAFALALLTMLAATSTLQAQNQPPRLTNSPEVRLAMLELYPAALKELRIGSTATVRVHVDAAGNVERAEIGTSSAFEPLDSAALQVARRMRFTPASEAGEPVAMTISVPLTFRPSMPEVEEGISIDDLAFRPSFRNEREIMRAVGAECRRTSRTATARVTMLIGSQGRPIAVQLSQPSGVGAIDRAAVRLALTAEFSVPEEYEVEFLPYWVTIPLTCNALR